MLGGLFTPVTKLFELDLVRDEFLVLAGHIIDPFAGSASQFNKSIF